MDYNRVQVRNVRDHYSDLVDRMNEMVVDGSRVSNIETLQNGLSRSRIGEAVNVVMLRNEIYELFKHFYRFSEWTPILERALSVHGNLPFLRLIAERMRHEVVEEEEAIRSALEFDAEQHEQGF